MTKQQLESIVRNVVRQELSSLIKNPKFIKLITSSILQETLKNNQRQEVAPQRQVKKRPASMANDILSDVNYASQNNYQTERKKPSGKIREILKQKVQRDDLSLESDFWGDEFSAPQRQQVEVPEYIKNNPLMAQTAKEMMYQAKVQQNTHVDDRMILGQLTSGMNFEQPVTDDYRAIDSSVQNAQVLGESRDQGSAFGQLSSMYNDQYSEVMNGPSVMDLSENAKRKFSFLNRDYGELI